MNAIETIDAKNLTIGHAFLGQRGNRQGSVREQVHDGDTVSVRAAGNIGVRLLGIDTPEVSFRLPGGQRFVSLSSPEWSTFLNAPFDSRWPPFESPLCEGLRRDLESRLGPDTAAHHNHHAQLAETAFEREIERDLQIMRQPPEEFRLFLAFGYEVMDGYGRFLCFINREQPNPQQPAPRPPSYNERLLRSGHAAPYFIWPNVNPFRKADSIIEAVLKPGTANRSAMEDETLREARKWVAAARAEHRGLFDAMAPSLLEPFELRMLARRAPPQRWVIDLSMNDDVLVHPQNYYTIPRAEDRLFISPEFVPLFVEHGWKRQPPPK